MVGVSPDVEESTESADEEQATLPRRGRANRMGLQLVGIFLVLTGIFAIGAAMHGFQQGWIVPFWSGLSDAQGSIIASCITLYAAALAVVVGPLIFTGQISSMREASELTLVSIDSEVRRMTEKLEYVRKIVRQTEEAVETPEDGLQFSAEKALLQLEGIREDATALAQQIVEKSNKWSTTKEKTRRKWPGRQPYYNMLQNLGFISEEQRNLFVSISETRHCNLAAVSERDVEKAEAALSKLKQLAS